jgi:serine/threonine-protein kinase
MDVNAQRDRFFASRHQVLSNLETGTSLNTLDVGVALDAPPLPRFIAGDLINGRYEVNHILGEGGMGVVYHVRDRMFQLRATALKTMRRLRDGEWLDLFRSEFIALSELNHPNVASVYEFAPLSGAAGHFFTMEFVQGQSLRRACEGATPLEIWRSISQMGEALAYLHSRDILHLDVKPDNAVRLPDGTCKLLDFGLVGLAQKPGRIAGTLAYMDPQLLQSTLPSVLSDLYCLGISGLELLVGCPPVRGRTKRRRRGRGEIQRTVRIYDSAHGGSTHLDAELPAQVVCRLRP